MNDAKMLEHLKTARFILEKSYVKFTENDGKGGHCAVGALAQYGGWAALDALTQSAWALHPELAGARAPRNIVGTYDDFDASPVVYINNQTDKPTTLAVFDAAILDLEIKLSPQPAPEAREAVEMVR